MRLPILYQDDAIVVVDKPAGIPSHAAAAGDPWPADARGIVQAQLGLAWLGAPHWLPAEASGVLLLTGQRQVQTKLVAAFAGRAVEQVYLALVYGKPPRPAGVIQTPLARAEGDRYRVAAPRDKRGQPAVTRYRLIETSPNASYSLLEVAPETGLREQSRVHLAYLGVPVVGDTWYGTGQPAPRLGLHLSRLTLAHPITGERLIFTAAPPPLFTRLATGLPELALAASGRVRSLRAPVAGLVELIELAAARRTPLAAGGETTIYRVINGAADGFAGLAVDRYGDALVVNVYDEAGRIEPLSAGLFHALTQATHAAAVYVKYRQRQASQVEEDALPALAPRTPAVGRVLGEITAREEGLAYLLRPGEGWNPGLFPDMREMRSRVRAWALGKQVLNCFAYTCGFGLAARAGGAARVVNLDVSWPGLERGRANYRANGFADDPQEFLYGDVFDLLPRLAQQQERFDIVILDPPGFARTKTHTFSAARDYGKLVQAAAAVLAPDGLLVACCNVADLSWESLRNRVTSGLDAAWRAAEIVGVYQASALDFPAGAGQGSDLKVVVARLAAP